MISIANLLYTFVHLFLLMTHISANLLLYRHKIKYLLWGNKNNWIAN